MYIVRSQKLVKFVKFVVEKNNFCFKKTCRAQHKISEIRVIRG